MNRLVVLLAFVLVAFVPASCGQASSGSSIETQLTVLAAASLKGPFTELGTAYQRGTASFSFAGSQELAAQVKQGAPADVIVTADERTMDGLGGQISDRSVIARNVLTIAVAAGNPRKIAGLADLARSDVTLVLAGPTVPIGRYARQSLDKAKVRVRPKSDETSVDGVIQRVQMGEADAGIVYATDVKRSAGKLEAVAIPDTHNVPAAYPAAVITATKQKAQAKAFVDWLASPPARAVLIKHGFLPP